jgi:hypothetical protein
MALELRRQGAYARVVHHLPVEPSVWDALFVPRNTMQSRIEPW